MGHSALLDWFGSVAGGGVQEELSGIIAQQDAIVVLPLPSTWVLMLGGLLVAFAAYRLFSVPD